jgi:restriction system protein
MLKYKYDELFNPVIKAIHSLGGSASNSEIEEKIIEILELTEDEYNDMHNESSSKLNYRLAWAKSYLKKAGYVNNSERGVWSLTDLGRQTDKVERKDVKRLVKSLSKDSERFAVINHDDDIVDEIEWQDEVLEIMRNITPDQFERLCMRLLREIGFVNVEVTGRPGDNGIDGKGILKIGGILSFHVAFQAKRYSGSVGSSTIRDFQGATMGRVDKGIVITTGSFTRDARQEAARDGATPIDLIDGQELAEWLKKLELGIIVEMVEEVSVKRSFFENL